MKADVFLNIRCLAKNSYLRYYTLLCLADYSQHRFFPTFSEKDNK